MKPIKKIGIAAFFLGLVVVFAAFVSLQYKKGHKSLPAKEEDKGFAVVELFTSEGCSSCPPADDAVARLQKENPLKSIYILAYHVDYWDRQGWKDVFSDPDYTKRQTKYSDWLHLESIYTPQIVINGKTEFVGSKEGLIAKAITAGLQEVPVINLTIKSSIVNREVIVDYQTNGTLQTSDIVVALIQKSGQSKVKAGENSGRMLNHVQIVRKLRSETLRINTGKLSFTLPKDYKSNEWEVIGFVQNNMNGEIMSAAKSGLIVDAIK